ncbi:hypothetical protein D9756_011269 [Leucocoprinus leucothites]|uniref:Carboxypeptidase n=1 Tax=Leucocoprinus leucothites TaxID=201217 RepID=A0A8H5CQY4_9AGAR|nr:hypothetical protein D9756_011269 [Leucoagaricus leucothites]
MKLPVLRGGLCKSYAGLLSGASSLQDIHQTGRKSPSCLVFIVTTTFRSFLPQRPLGSFLLIEHVDPPQPYIPSLRLRKHPCFNCPTIPSMAYPLRFVGSKDEEIMYINRETRRLEELIRNLENQKAELLQRLNALNSPVNSLPVETLSTIFEFVCPPYDLDTRIHLLTRDQSKFSPKPDNAVDLMEPEHLQLVLGAVSARWRSVVRATPRIWTSIVLDVSTTDTEHTSAFMRLCLENSGQLPICLTLDYSVDFGHSDPGVLVHESVDHLVIDNLSRCRGLHLTHPPAAWFSHFPSLSQLADCSIDGHRQFGTELVLPRATPLRRFAIRVPERRAQTLLQLPWSGITSLAISQMEFQYAAQMLLNCPNLIEFRCCQSRRPGAINTPVTLVGPVVLQVLEVLELSTVGDCDWARAIVQHLRTPSLRQLQWKGFHDPPGPLQAFFDNLPSTLTTVSLHTSSPLQYLRLDSNIERLTLHNCIEEDLEIFLENLQKQVSQGRGCQQAYDDGLFSPLEDLSFVSTHTYTTLSHPAFPRHNVRIKKSHEFCDPTVNSYTGYIDIEARHIFFYFFESRNDPDTDDVIFWTNGGLFMEFGPCRVKDENSTIFHPESWNANANIFFVDQPVGVGFSYAEHGEAVGTTEDAAKDIASFVAIFFEHFTKFKGRAFHMAGESYGGRYVPVFASEVYDQNTRLAKAGLTPINLQSIMIGNGITDFATTVLSYYDMQCTSASVPPVMSISKCVAIKQIIPRCEKWLKKSCLAHFDAIDCAAAASFCDAYLTDSYDDLGLNPYDMTRECTGELKESLCYPIIRTIGKYLDQPTLRTSLGVDPSITANFSSCDEQVGTLFSESLDMYHRTHLHIAALLERGVRTLIYVGTYDWICNWVGNERWTLNLEWSGHDDFSGEELKEWNVDGHKAGLVRSKHGLTFATVDAAGHMVPYDKPREALVLVQRWLAKEDL